MNDIEHLKEITKLKPWNSSDNQIKVNSIRYNHDFSLLTLGTSQGYRVFLTSNLKLCNEISEANINFGSINIAMVYYKSSLVFLLPSKTNQKYSSKELIIFDDFYQNKLASFKTKNQDISNFFLSKNVLFILTLNKIIVIELFSFKTIEIIENINYIIKLISFNFADYLCYLNFQDKKTVIIKKYENENYKAISIMNKVIKPSFNYIQIIQISPNGDLVGLVSIFGNKIHIYYTHTGQLKACIYAGTTIQTFEKIFFSEKKQNYLLFFRNDNKFYIYKMDKMKINVSKCICDKYNDDSLINGKNNQDEFKNDFFGLKRKLSKNKDIKEIHAFSDYEGILLFNDFDRNKHKDLILINNEGQLTKYHFNKKKSGKINSNLKIQWM